MTNFDFLKKCTKILWLSNDSLTTINNEPYNIAMLSHIAMLIELTMLIEILANPLRPAVHSASWLDMHDDIVFLLLYFLSLRILSYYVTIC